MFLFYREKTKAKHQLAVRVEHEVHEIAVIFLSLQLHLLHIIDKINIQETHKGESAVPEKNFQRTAVGPQCTHVFCDVLLANSGNSAKWTSDWMSTVPRTKGCTALTSDAGKGPCDAQAVLHVSPTLLKHSGTGAHLQEWAAEAKVQLVGRWPTGWLRKESETGL